VELSYSYNLIGLHRSATSAYHDPINGIPVGSNNRIKALMSGIWNKNPPRRKYLFTWDVDIVLNYLKALPVDDSISDKLLTLK